MRYQPIRGATVIIDGATRLAGLSYGQITQALERVATERARNVTSEEARKE